MIFVDASAFIAIITGEDGAEGLADRLEQDRDRLCSAISIWETVAGLCRSYSFSILAARDHARRFMAGGGMRLIEIGALEFGLATEAYAQFGKGRHPAVLNMGNCFAYARSKEIFP